MVKNFNIQDWKSFLPLPISEEFSGFETLYSKAWELAYQHVKYIDGMPQNPYMDEAFCDTLVWIWDTCFMTLFCKYAQEVFPGVETFQNFYYVLHEGGHLPEVIPTEKEPQWTKNIPGVPTTIRIQHVDNPPLFAWAEYENALIHGDKDYLKELLYQRKVLQKHYDWFENLTSNSITPDWGAFTSLQKEKWGYKWRGTPSGMDNTPRGRINSPTEVGCPDNPNMLWLDAICQQALSAKNIADLFHILGDEVQEKEWNEKYLKKKNIVNELYWDKEDKFYYDIDCNDKHFYKVQTIASYWPLTAEIASPEQAYIMAEYLRDDKLFGGEVPLVSLARNDKDFVNNGCYWRGSVWLPCAYATLKGLTKYGFHEIARELAIKLVSHMWKTYNTYEPHTIWECYAPNDAKPATYSDDICLVRPDFCGWSALGPISIYIEYVLGFHTINAFEKVVEWSKPVNSKNKIGIKNLRFADIVTDIVAHENVCTVKSNAPYTLKINGNDYLITPGENRIYFKD